MNSIVGVIKWKQSRYILVYTLKKYVMGGIIRKYHQQNVCQCRITKKTEKMEKIRKSNRPNYPRTNSPIYVPAPTGGKGKA